MKRKILIIVSFILFLVFLIMYLTNHVNFIDTTIYELIIKLKSDSFTKFMKFITFFASTKFITSIVIILFIISLFKGKLPLIVNWIILGEMLINNIIKVIIKRDRPTLINLVTETTYSFPSGHTMIAVVLYGLLIYLCNKSNINKKFKIIFTVLFTILIILIMMSRIYLGAHFFSDVIAGACLAMCYLLLMISIFERRYKL